ncbi:hypothetical protein LTR37_001997 [Vermiconidia calcicola]|uniref:Uncharacterized protein n=1 Tax=Vermiconidia calcicola TaxID=1690605 RepID=A0ACC3NUR3_9PEZI|nr:hypothetical protein LTR37_001997 [Vermiconidia calcicola]
MASLRTALRAAPRAHLLRPTTTTTSRIAHLAQRSYARPAVPQPATDEKSAGEAEQAQEDLTMDNTDPNMNGNYPDPNLTSALPIKRQFRDAYGDWWDPIERRNYGETVHEDNDILGIFSPEEYTHFSPAWGGVLVGCFVATVGALMAVVYRYYPDKPSAPRTFPGGLERELGGLNAVRARMTEEEESVL